MSDGLEVMRFSRHVEMTDELAGDDMGVFNHCFQMMVNKKYASIYNANEAVKAVVKSNTWQGFPPFDLFALKLFTGWRKSNE